MLLPGLRAPWLVASTIVASMAAAGCHGPGGRELLSGTAADEWIRSYTLLPGGTVEITNRNGLVDIEGVDGTGVEVRAERIAKAPTDAGALELLPRIQIEEEAGPDRVALVTDGIEGMLIAASYEVRYHVQVPRDANLRIRVRNGALAVRNITGSVVLNSTNGALTAESLGGGVEARAVNGKVVISLSRVGDDAVDVRSTNGGIELSLPQDANALVMATATNGRVVVEGLALDPTGEQSNRRVRGRLNGGGTPIELTSVNGGVRVTARP